jgi:PAS domain S-box-containing protein
VITPEEGRPAQRATPPARDFAPYLAEASEVLASSLDYQETLKNLAHLVVPDLADWCAIDMLEEDGSINQLVLTHEDPDKVALAQELRRRFPPDLDAPQGVPHVLRSGKAEFYPEVTGEMLVATARDAEHLRIMREVGFASVMIVPLVARGRTLGAITLVWAGSGRRHEPEDLALAEDLARRAALAVDNARLYREAQREIAKRERAEEEARGSWSQLEVILRGIADGVTAQDPTGRVVYANEVAARMLGYPSARAFLETRLQEVMQKFEIFGESGRPFPLENLPGRRALEGEEGVEEVLRFRVVATGEERWSVVRAMPVFDEGGRIRLAVNIFHDITKIKHAEEELRRSEERFRSLVQHGSDIITVLDAEGTIRYVSPAVERVLGYAPEEIFGESPLHFVHPDDHEEAMGLLAEVSSEPGVQAPFEFSVPHKDGSWRYLEHTVNNLLDDPSVGGIVINQRDVTERKRVQETRLRLAAIIESSDDAIIGKTLDGTITSWNEGAERIYGYSANETVGQPISMLVPPDRPEEIPTILESIRRGQKVDHFETVRVTKDGRRLDISLTVSPIRNPAGDVVGASAIARDITERKRAEDELRESEERFRATFEQAAVGVAHGSTDGRLLRVNDKLCEILGYTREEMLRLTSQDISWPEDNDADLEYARRVLAGEIESYSMEKRYFRKDGSVIWANLAVSLVRDSAGDPEYFIGAIEDITERKRAEDQLREREIQYRDIFEATGDGLVITDLDGNLVDANPAFCSMHGYDSSELLVGRHAKAWLHRDHHRLHDEYVATIKAGHRFQAQAVDVRRDGTSFPVEIHGSAFAYRGKPHALLVVRDVTERARAYELLERRVEERTRELSTLLEVSNDVASTLELEPLLGLILEQLRAVVDYTDSSLLVFEGEDLVTVGYRGPVPQEQIMGTRFPPGRGRRMLEGSGDTMEPIIIDDVRGDAPLAVAYRQVVGEERLRGDFGHIRSWLGVPLVSKEQRIGLLAIMHEEPGHYTDKHIELATAFANQAAVAIENARLYERVQSAAVLEERQRLARELHDSVSQALYGITLGADAARKLLDRDPGRAAEPVDYILSLAQAGLAEMRALIFELRPESLESEGLIAALEKQAAALRARHEIPVRVTTLCEEPDMPPEAKDALYRVAQEALHNTVKHARANHAEIRLKCSTEGVVLEIIDDGAGFDSSSDFPGHLGLHSMRERAERLGGTLDVESKSRRGTRIVTRIPAG